MGVKKKQWDMGVTGYNKNDWKAYRWCIRNNIAIAPLAKSNNSWYLVIRNKGAENVSPEAYGKNEIWQKMFEYCRYYFEKYNKISYDEYTG